MSYTDRYTKALEELLSSSEPATTPVSSAAITTSPGTSTSNTSAMEVSDTPQASPPTGSPTTIPKWGGLTQSYGSSILERVMPIFRRHIWDNYTIGVYPSSRETRWGLDYKKLSGPRIRVEPLGPVGQYYFHDHVISSPCAEKSVCPACPDKTVSKRTKEWLYEHTHSTSAPVEVPKQGIITGEFVAPGGHAFKYKPEVKLRLAKSRSGTNGFAMASLEKMMLPTSDHYPTAGGCPSCGSDCYVGLNKIECSNGACVNYG